MKIIDAFPSKYLKVQDLKGRHIPMTIGRVHYEQVADEDKLVCYFEGARKGLVLNKTNATTIQEITGSDDTDEWPGVEIVLYPDKTDFQGKRVACIRVEAKKDKPDTSDDVPF